MNNFYVYAYLRKDETPYYIGKGKDRRAFVKENMNRVPKDKTRIKFLHKDIDEILALDLEMFWIAFYGRKDLGTGILRNLTDGGEGPSGRIPHNKGKPSPMKGKKVPNISKALKGNIPWNKGKPSPLKGTKVGPRKNPVLQPKRKGMTAHNKGNVDPKFTKFIYTTPLGEFTSRGEMYLAFPDMPHYLLDQRCRNNSFGFSRRLKSV